MLIFNLLFLQNKHFLILQLNFPSKIQKKKKMNFLKNTSKEIYKETA